MSSAEFSVLLVEDNPADAILVGERLGGAANSVFDLEHVESMSEAREILERQKFDVVLCDLGLPDCDSTETVSAIVSAAKECPVIVLTGLDDGNAPLEALRAGAQDFVTKDFMASPNMARETLVRSIRYSIARMGGRRRDRRDLGEADRVLVDLVTGYADTSVTARTYGHLSLSEGAPQLFAKLIGDYVESIKNAIREVSFRIETDKSRTIAEMGHALGRFGATPKDVVDLHVSALRQASKGKNPAQVRGMKDEARLILVEVMGHLAAYYRRHAWRGESSSQPRSE